MDLSAAQRIGALDKLVADDDIAAGRMPVSWSSGPDRIRQRRIDWCETLTERGGLWYVLGRRRGDWRRGSVTFAEMLELHRAEGFIDVDHFPPVALLFHHETGIVATVERWSPPGGDCEPVCNVARWYFTALRGRKDFGQLVFWFPMLPCSDQTTQTLPRWGCDSQFQSGAEFGYIAARCS